MRFTQVLLALCALPATSMLAVPALAQSVSVANAWVRAPAPGQRTAGAYLELTSPGGAALVAVGSAAAARAEMHSTTMDSGVMRMRALPRIELPAGQTVRLAPGGLHIMLIDIRQTLKPGDKVPLVLSVQPAGPDAGSSLTTLNVEAEVRAAATTPHGH